MAQKVTGEVGRGGEWAGNPERKVTSREAATSAPGVGVGQEHLE